MQLRLVNIERFRAIQALTLVPGERNVILGPQSTVVEALDLLLHHGIGRPRPAPTEIDYFGRDPTEGFVIEAVVERSTNRCSRKRTGSSRAGARRLATLSLSRREMASSQWFGFGFAARPSSTFCMNLQSRRRKESRRSYVTMTPATRANRAAPSCPSPVRTCAPRRGRRRRGTALGRRGCTAR